MAVEEGLTSPVIDILKTKIQQGDHAELARFWERMESQGTPIVESIEDAPEYSLVTFVWRAPDPDQKPQLVSNLPGRDETLPMEHLAKTDLWYLTFKAHKQTRDSYQFKVAGENRVDPLNPAQHAFPGDEEIGFPGWVSSVLELSEAPPQPWTELRAEVPPGQLIQHRIQSEILDREYRFWVYLPPEYNADTSGYGFILAFDGWFYVNLIPTPTIIDNLLADKLTPPMAAVMVGAPFDRTRARDLACYPPFEEFIIRELLPWVRENFNLSSDPAHSAVAGTSRGGLMACYMGLKHSNIFGHVVSQSGAVGWFPDGDTEADWLARECADATRLRLDFYLEAGMYENEIGIAGRPMIRNLLIDNRHLRTVLEAKGYLVHYSEFYGGHNPMNWQGTFANAIISLFGPDAGREE